MPKRMPKPSIYPQTETNQVQPPGDLELLIRDTRLTITDYFSSTHKQVNQWVDEWMDQEKRLRQLVSDLKHKYHDPQEPLLPAGLYVVLSGFGGSILTKNRTLDSSRPSDSTQHCSFGSSLDDLFWFFPWHAWSNISQFICLTLTVYFVAWSKMRIFFHSLSLLPIIN